MSVTSAEKAPSDRRLLVLTVALAVLGVFVTYVPITAVSVSLTTIQGSTGASTSDLQWVSDSFIIPMAAIVLSAGVFGDLLGRRRVYLAGMALTVAGALVAGLAGTLDGRSSVHLLWAGQAISGVGAGLLLPTTLALIAHAVPDPRERGPYIGIWATGLMLGLAVGPIIAGLILEFAGWGWIFVPTAILALGAGALALARLPESKAPAGRHLDWPGQISASIAIGASIFGVIEGGKDGWGSTAAVIGLGVGAVALVVFIMVELRSSSPLMHLELFRSPPFAAAGFSALIALFSIVGSMFLFSLFLGGVQNLSPLEIGWRLLFCTGVAVLLNPFVGILLGRVKPLGLLAAGLLVAAASMVLLTGIDENSGFAAVAWRLAIFGVADALMLSSVSVVAINAVPHRLAGMAAATNTAMRQYGGALGPAVLGVVLASRLKDGATPAAAFHTAVLVTAALLAVAAIACLLAALRPVARLERLEGHPQGAGGR